jgi:hypothetical protein
MLLGAIHFALCPIVKREIRRVRASVAIFCGAVATAERAAGEGF